MKLTFLLLILAISLVADTLANTRLKRTKHQHKHHKSLKKRVQKRQWHNTEEQQKDMNNYKQNAKGDATDVETYYKTQTTSGKSAYTKMPDFIDLLSKITKSTEEKVSLIKKSRGGSATPNMDNFFKKCKCPNVQVYSENKFLDNFLLNCYQRKYYEKCEDDATKCGTTEENAGWKAFMGFKRGLQNELNKGCDGIYDATGAQPTTVYRGFSRHLSSPPPDGKFTIIYGFISLTGDLGIALKYASQYSEGKGTIIEIKLQDPNTKKFAQGKWIHECSAYPEEKEFLNFAKKNCFKIDARSNSFTVPSEHSKYSKNPKGTDVNFQKYTLTYDSNCNKSEWNFITNNDGWWDTNFANNI